MVYVLVCWMIDWLLCLLINDQLILHTHSTGISIGKWIRSGATPDFPSKLQPHSSGVLHASKPQQANTGLTIIIDRLSRCAHHHHAGVLLRPTPATSLTSIIFCLIFAFALFYCIICCFVKKKPYYLWPWWQWSLDGQQTTTSGLFESPLDAPASSFKTCIDTMTKNNP
jgi:hypothetical protein